MKAKNIHTHISLGRRCFDSSREQYSLCLLYARHEISKNTTVEANKHFHEEIYFYLMLPSLYFFFLLATQHLCYLLLRISFDKTCSHVCISIRSSFSMLCFMVHFTNWFDLKKIIENI